MSDSQQEVIKNLRAAISAVDSAIEYLRYEKGIYAEKLIDYLTEEKEKYNSAITKVSRIVTGVRKEQRDESDSSQEGLVEKQYIC